MHLFLFDIDGVLVDAQGYLRALQDSVAHFSQAMGISGDQAPTEKEVRTFEAVGMTSEWDSLPACLAAVLLGRLQQEPDFPLPDVWPAALDALGVRPREIPRPDYSALAQEIGARIRSTGEVAARAAHGVLSARAASLPAKWHGALERLLSTLLDHTHDFARAPLTQHFQHRVIGSAGVARTYGITAQFECAPYLQTHDSTNLTAGTRAALFRAQERDEMRAVLYTARPSLPPQDSGSATRGYSPEAELARELVGLEPWPLIGFGHMQWLGERVGVAAENMVKPSAVQALAAIGAAWLGRETVALQSAWTLFNEQRLEPPLADLPDITLHVFEDSSGGMHAVTQASALLHQAGKSNTLVRYGITPASGAKEKAMRALGVSTYRSVNSAVKRALGQAS